MADKRNNLQNLISPPHGKLYPHEQLFAAKQKAGPALYDQLVRARSILEAMAKGNGQTFRDSAIDDALRQASEPSQ